MPSSISQSVVLQTWEQEVAGSIPGWPIFSPKIDDGYCERIHSSLTPVHCFNVCHVGKQPVAWQKYCAENWLTHSHTMTPFDAPGKEAFWKHCGKRRNCSYRAISPFPAVFSTCLDNFLPFLSNLKLSSANSFSLDESKMCRLVMGWKNFRKALWLLWYDWNIVEASYPGRLYERAQYFEWSSNVKTLLSWTGLFNPLPDTPILGSCNSAANKDLMSKIWTNGDTIIWWVENIVEKGEIACYKQFLLFPQCFQNLSVADVSKYVSMM